MPAIILSFLGICILASLILFVVTYGSRRKNTKEVGLASDIVSHLNGDSKPLGLLVDIYEEIPELVDLPKSGISGLNFFHKDKEENNKVGIATETSISDSELGTAVIEKTNEENTEADFISQENPSAEIDKDLSETVPGKSSSAADNQEHLSDIFDSQNSGLSFASDNYDTVVMEAIPELKDSEGNSN